MNKLAESNLPPKQISNFKDLVKLYESKQFKKGLKLADKMLEVIPDNSETLCMKGLLLNMTDKEEEGLAMAKAALMKNFKSEICWHVLGIIHRNNKSYGEAIKCYNMALKFDKNNLQILRDLALLQMQMRDYKGHFKTRQALLQDKPQLPINWVGFALANHFVKDYKQTIEVLKSLWKIILNDSEVKDQEKNEVISYEASLLLEAGMNDDLLVLLKDRKHLFLDQLFYNQCLFECHSNLNNKEEALQALAKLQAINPNDNNYTLKEAELKQLSGEALTAFYFEKINKDPLNMFLQIEHLKHVSQQETFNSHLQTFLKPFFIKGIPSLFGKLKTLYPQKADWIQSHLRTVREQLMKDKTFPKEEEEQSPSCILWADMVLGQHYDQIGKLGLAREHLDRAIQHTPTLVDLYLFRAKVEKHSGCYEEASQLVRQAMELDLADRYLNNKAIKYTLRAGQIDTAQSLFKEFMKEDSNAHDLQTMWYEIETAKAYSKQGNQPAAIRWSHFIQTHYDEIYDDQFDFYTFSLKKYNLRYFIEICRHEDTLRGNQKYLQTAIQVIPVLIDYHKEQKSKEESVKEEGKKLKGGEKKKARKEVKEEEKEDKYDLMGIKHVENMKCPLEEADRWACHILKVQGSIRYPVLLGEALLEVWQLAVYEESSVERQTQVMKGLLDTKQESIEIRLAQAQYVQLNKGKEEAKVMLDTLQALSLETTIEQMAKEYTFGHEQMQTFSQIRLQMINGLSSTESLQQLNTLLSSSVHLQFGIYLFNYMTSHHLTIDTHTRLSLNNTFPETSLFSSLSQKTQNQQS